MIHGRDLILSINGTPIAASTTCDLSTITDFIDVCAPAGGEWKDYIPTQHGWEVSAGCLMVDMSNFDQMFKWQKSKQRLDLSFYDSGLQTFYKGSAYIKKLNTTGNYGNLAKFSVAFQPCGELKSATAVIIDMTAGTVISGKNLIFGIYETIMVGDRSDRSVYAKGLTIHTDTRFTIPKGMVVLKGNISDIEALINTNDNESLNAAVIISNGTVSSKSVVHKTTTAQAITILSTSVVVNRTQPTILSKF